MYPSFSDKSFLPGAIYLRLSKDDEGAKESLSIANQRKCFSATPQNMV